MESLSTTFPEDVRLTACQLLRVSRGNSFGKFVSIFSSFLFPMSLVHLKYLPRKLGTRKNKKRKEISVPIVYKDQMECCSLRDFLDGLVGCFSLVSDWEILFRPGSRPELSVLLRSQLCQRMVII